MRTKLDSRILILMLLIIIEVMGIGIIFPMLPELFIAKNSVLLAADTTDSLRHLYYGISIGLLPLGMFFGTPYLGELSDKFGRKKIFLICLMMTAVSYSLSAFAVYSHSMWLFFTSRLLAGIFAGSYEIAQAAVVDLSTNETKARNLGWIVFAASLGFVIGPMITTFTADKSSIFSFGITTPFWIACSLSLMNAILMLFVFEDTFQAQPGHTIKLQKIFSSFLFVFTDKRLTYLSIIFFFLVCAWMSFFVGMPLYLVAVFNLKIATIGLFFCLIGISGIFTVLVLQRYIFSHFSLKKIITYTTFLSAILLSIAVLNSHFVAFVVWVFAFAIAEFLAYAGFLAFFSNAVTAEEQGKAMGGSAATSSVAFVITSLAVAGLADLDVRLPIVISAVFFFLIGVLVYKAR